MKSLLKILKDIMNDFKYVTDESGRLSSNVLFIMDSLQESKFLAQLFYLHNRFKYLFFKQINLFKFCTSDEESEVTPHIANLLHTVSKKLLNESPFNKLKYYVYF